MNPVDHVRCSERNLIRATLTVLSSLTVVVIISISVKLQLSRGMQRRVKRRVSSQLGELVCYVVHRRQRTKEVHRATEKINILVLRVQHLEILPKRLIVSNPILQMQNVVLTTKENS